MPSNPPSSQDTPRHELLVSAHMQYTVLKPKDTTNGKKAASTKKVENKNKEFMFVFDPLKENYMAFLSALLAQYPPLMFHNAWNRRGWQCPMAYGCSGLRGQPIMCRVITMFHGAWMSIWSLLAGGQGIYMQGITVFVVAWMSGRSLLCLKHSGGRIL